MPLSVWKSISKCATALLVEEKRRTSAPKKKKKKQRRGESPSSSLSDRRLQQEDKLRVALEEASEDGSLAFVSQDPSAALDADVSSSAQGRARRLHALREFLRSTALAADCSHYSPLSLPSLDESLSKFLLMYPKYRSTDRIDRLRDEEYPHLSSSSKVCLDYCGFGLFSPLQPHGGDSFTLSEITANLGNHALYGSGADPGTCEHSVKRRILDYLNVPDHEYGLVFTVSRGSAFKLLADSYPFQPHRCRLLTMFDHDSQSIHLMAHSARLRGAKVQSAWFRWPTLKPCSAELRKEIVGKKRRKKDASVGLFVFPVQSRVTGARYSYQWVSLAQQNGWHVLLDAGSLGPKDMDSLGLSLFRPDFIITSFYRVFGADPTGFGVLLIKKSVIGCLKNMNGKTGSGMVRIVPVYPQYLSDSVDGLDRSFEEEDAAALQEDGNQESPSPETHGGGGERPLSMPVFSGAFTSAQVGDVFESEMEQGNGSDRDGGSAVLEETESLSVGDLMKSPVFSEDGSSDSLLWIELGHSPYGSSDCSGQLGVQRQGPLSPPLWFSKRKGQEQLSPRVQSVVPKSPIRDNNNDDNNVLSFDAAVLSVSQELDRAEEAPEKGPVENGGRQAFFRFASVEEGPEIQEEEVILEVDAVEDSGKRIRSDSGFQRREDCRVGTSEVCGEKAPCTKENAITRETESEFRLLDRREGNNVFVGGKLFGREDHDQVLGTSSRRAQMSCYPSARETITSAVDDDDDDAMSDDDGGDTNDWQREPEIICRHLDHVNLMGLNKSSSRLRYLVNWLVVSLLQLKHPDPEGKDGAHLVCIYGPKIKYERGAAVAFNVKDSKKALINPEVVQKLAEKSGISLGVGFLSHVLIVENDKQLPGPVDLGDAPFCKPSSTRSQDGRNIIRVEVVTASLGFLTNFEDVYTLWAFVAKFLDPIFVEGERLPTITEAPES